MSTDFAFGVEPLPLIPFEFRFFTSRMDYFASNRLPITFKWRHYHIEARIRSTTSFGSSPILEYASISAGGRIIKTLTSDTYMPSRLSSLRNPFAIFSQVSRENSKHSPAVILADDIDGMEPGECWALRGDFGQIGIQFAHAIHLSSLVVGHANVASTASALKKLVIWGLKSANTDSGLCDTSGDEDIPTPDFGPGYCGIRLLSGIHNPLTLSVYQNFTISAYDDHYFDRIIVQVLSNWGQKDFTCIYRIQVYGNSQ
jgi:hypothetical protein